VVEGYMDVIAAHQFGFDNVVAQMGTALTDRQYKLLKRFNAPIVLVLDSDAAGQAAMEKVAVNVAPSEEVSRSDIRQIGFDVQKAAYADLLIAGLPVGKDPDELIRRDPDTWREVIAGAKPYVDFWLDHAASARDLRQPRERSALVTELLPLLAAIQDTVLRSHYVQRLSRLALTSEEDVTALLRGNSPKKQANRSTPNLGRRDNVNNPREDFLLALLIQYPNLREIGISIPEDLLWEAQSKQVLEVWKQFDEVDSVKEALPVELKSYLERLILWKLPISSEENAGEALEDCIGKLHQRRLQAEKQAIAAQIADLQEQMGPVGATGSDQTASGSLDEQLQHLLLRDMEIGHQLHSRGRRDGLSPVEIAVDG
jgi:DNA primase